MSYTVLARKYRPQTFADLVGQEHVSRTLANALQSGRVAHAFLFTGARGVGKTTTARLLAKALNCEQGPTATPCNQCDPCREITAGNDIDVLEIDGASNNGVDDVRRLQETLPFRPARDRFKIVIVDEVHMLSVGAFNAFLKTLEEPPAHVKFVFATTEIHKVPITIRSRCQRYDFRLIPHAVVAERVREILRAEQIVADDAAIALVAREAAGSMRDALTVLDQVLALGDKELHGESVARGLAIASRESVMQAVEALLSGDAAACLQCVSQIAEQGLDVLHFTRQLVECARDLVVLRVVGGSDNSVGLTPDELARAQRLAEAHDRAELERLFAGLTKLIEDVGQAAMPQMTLEMGLVRLASRPPLVSVQELITRLKSFEDLLSGGPGPAGPTSAPFGGGASGGGSRGAPPRRAPSAAGTDPRAEASASVSDLDLAPRPSGLQPESATPISRAQASQPAEAPRVGSSPAGPQLREATPIHRQPQQTDASRPTTAFAGPQPTAAARSVTAGPQLRDATSAPQPSAASRAMTSSASPASVVRAAQGPQAADPARPPARLVAVPPPPAANAPVPAADARPTSRTASGDAPAVPTHNLSPGAAAALRFSQSQALARNEEPVATTAARAVPPEKPNVAPVLSTPQPLAARAPNPANATQTGTADPGADTAPGSQLAAAPELASVPQPLASAEARTEQPENLRDPQTNGPRDPQHGASRDPQHDGARVPQHGASRDSQHDGARVPQHGASRDSQHDGARVPQHGGPSLEPRRESAQPGSRPAQPTAAAAGGAAAAVGESSMDSDWARIVMVVRSAQPALAAVLNHGMPIEVTAATLRIGFPDGSFFGRQAQSTSARESLLRAAEQVLGARPNLLIGPPGDSKVSTLAEIEEDGKRQRSAAKREAALTHPAVLDAMEIFGESEASVDVQVDIE